jgi:hypothetical protein
MLVLDEQLMGRDLYVALRRWYRGRIVSVPDLRPNTLIKDEAIPSLLRGLRQPALLTINDVDFWRKVDIDARFCVVCFPLSDARVPEIPELLRAVLRLREFRTKADRMGKVLRVTRGSVSYYTYRSRMIHIVRFGYAALCLGRSAFSSRASAGKRRRPSSPSRIHVHPQPSLRPRWWRCRRGRGPE